MVPLKECGLLASIQRVYRQERRPDDGLSRCAIGTTVGHQRLTSGRVHRAGFDKTERVTPFVFGVKRSLAPGPHADRTASDTMYIVSREAIQGLRAGEGCVQVVDREIQRLCRGMRLAYG